MWLQESSPPRHTKHTYRNSRIKLEERQTQTDKKLQQNQNDERKTSCVSLEKVEERVIDLRSEKQGQALEEEKKCCRHLWLGG